MALTQEGVKFSDFVRGLPSASEADLAAGNNMPLVRAGDVKKLPAEKFEASPLSKIVNDKEYIYAITDSSGKILVGIKNDGSFEWFKGCPALLKQELQTVAEELALKVDKETGKALVNSTFAESVDYQDLPEYIKVLLDNESKVLEAIDNDGYHIFKKGIKWSKSNLDDLASALKENGFSGGQGDWSDKKSVVIPMPSFGILNITGVSALPTTKTENMSAVAQFWDVNGNYFKKPVVLNAQGNSTLVYPKKNFTIDLLNDDGSDFTLKVGELVEQKSFHLKANYIDYFRGVTCIGYDLYKDISNTRNPLKNRTWKTALLQNGQVDLCDPADITSVDDGALCFPYGFPFALYLNNQFYGLYTWQVKKHAGNYHLNTKSATNIHLDGSLSPNFWNGTINWASFEIRSPKNLYTMGGASYDGDNPTEIADSASVESWITAGVLPDGTAITSKIASNLRNTASVKSSIVSLSARMNEINSAASDTAKKALVETYFDVENLIDYQIFGDLILNFDGFWKNWQWTTWDGVKWFVNPYDLDSTFGQESGGSTIHLPLTNHFGTSAKRPTNYAIQLYAAQLEKRWADLRASGIISSENICGKFSDWTATIGKDYFALEYEKWTDCPCSRSIEVNTDYWELVKENGRPKIVLDGTATNKYSSSTSYVVGEVVEYNKASSFGGGSFGWYYQLRCVAATTGNPPITKFGVHDSVFRVCRWVEKNIKNMDIVYNFNQQ